MYIYLDGGSSAQFVHLCPCTDTFKWPEYSVGSPQHVPGEKKIYLGMR